MNLGQIVTLAESRLRYAPNTSSHDRDIKGEIQVKHAAVLGVAEWPFLRKTANFDTYADQDDVATATFTAGSTLVSLTVGATDATWLGAHVIGPDGEAYEVVYVASSSSLNIYPAYAGTTATDTFDVHWIRYALPKDCGDVAAFIDRVNSRTPIPLRRAEEAWVNFRPNQTGQPSVVLEADALQEYAPLDTLTASVGSGGANNLAASRTYRYLYTFEFGGRESGASNIVSATTTGSNKTITLTLENTTANSGRRKRIYRDSGSGVFQYLTTVSETTTSWPDDGAVTASRTERFEEDHTALRRYLRFERRPAADTTYEIQYYRKTPALIADSDVPMLPSQYHELLVELVVAEFKKREAMDISAHRVAIEEAIARMGREYFKDNLQSTVKKPWRGRPTGFGNVTKTVSVLGGFASLVP